MENGKKQVAALKLSKNWESPMFQDQSPIQTQLGEINNLYDMIRVRLSDRDCEMANMREEIKIHLDNLKQILSFLEKQEKALSTDDIPSDKKKLDKHLKQILDVLDQLYENQPLLDKTKVGTRELLKKIPEAPGSKQLDDKLNQVVGRLEGLAR
jgi:hypothetical protein